MMGQLNRNQGQLFYSFCLEEVVPTDHLVRDIAAVLDLDWVRAELAPYYSPLGRPSIDPSADDPDAHRWGTFSPSNSWKFLLREAVWAEKGVCDATEKLRAAATSI
jgi:hypothetical protein